MPSSFERLTAFGNQLIEVHLWLREELGVLREDVERSLSGGARPRELRAHCLTFCSALNRHHQGEDGNAFHVLAEQFPELRPVLEELSADHRVIEDSLRGLQALVDGLSPESDPARVRSELDGLAALMETHFTYEERRLVAALNALDVPEWRRDRPAFLQTTDPDEGTHMTRAAIEEHTVAGPEDGPYAITTGPDGALWFTLVEAAAIGRLVPGEEPRRFAVAPGSGPTIITPGPDGALWFTEYRANRIGRITTDGDVTEFPLPTAEARPFGIVTGPDGALWFTETATDGIGRITVDGAVTEFPLPVRGAFPSAITAGPDGALWFTMNQANAIGRITTGGETTLYDLPTEGAAPVGIAAGDDCLWFVEIGAGQIGRIDLDGRVTEFALPDRASRPHAVTVDGDGVPWFTEWAGNRLGSITGDGTVTGHDLPTPKSEPHGLVLGPDQALWAALEIGSLARLPLG
ncbi:virginiamycin B lyase family protein [Actinomadura harenae]|uniref:Virginiamycin B lyase n=1 Tax=Actinomadura harenae TaxID=2483351 RepID=A0A3M2M8Y0_9ACTN|nr:hemerythrin domain-containing protein [Actinomadura harenae]RMI45921.1 hypothetical protein EBO15_08385 [Actinomadura harenae]